MRPLVVLRDAPGGGSGYNPLLEIYQPQIRHVVQAKEQRLGDCEDEAGPFEPSPGTSQPKRPVT